MTLALHRRLIWIESIAITLPMLFIVCYFTVLGAFFGAVLITSESPTVGCEFVAIAMLGFIGFVAVFYLNYTFLKEGLQALRRTTRPAWFAASGGAILALLAIFARVVGRVGNLESNDWISGIETSLGIAVVGVPLLIPYLHLLYLRYLSPLEVSPP